MILPKLLAGLLIVVTWVGIASDDNRPCSMSDISFFRSLSCKEGHIGQGWSCACGLENGGDCKLPGLRVYLPDRKLFEEVYYNRQEIKCNRLFRLALSSYLMSTKSVSNHTGYPQDCTKANECHKPSLGKFIRYNSLMQFHAFKGGKNDTLFDFQYPFGFRWSTSVTSCVNAGLDKTWQCGFQPFSDILRAQGGTAGSLIEKVDNLESTKEQQGLSRTADSTKLFLEKAMTHVDLIRREKKNHITQVLLYSRMLSLIARPSEHAIKYMSSRTVTINPHVAESYFKEQYKGNFTIHDTNAHGFGTFHRQPPSISLHVRQGDSCDTTLGQPVAEMTNYLKTSDKGDITRPCFSIDVYMRLLRSIREKYGVLRVYLSTDSVEMLRRIEKEPDFTWIYVNSSRTMYTDRKGPSRYIDYLANSNNEDVLFGVIADLALLSKGDIFLGAFSSHMSKIAYYAMVGHHMRILPFYSLDYSLDCDTTDSCTREDISKRNLTLEKLATWAPECIRGQIPWSPRPDRDPCGIYL